MGIASLRSVTYIVYLKPVIGIYGMLNKYTIS